jgi:hypothetical protein
LVISLGDPPGRSPAGSLPLGEPVGVPQGPPGPPGDTETGRETPENGVRAKSKMGHQEFRFIGMLFVLNCLSPETIQKSSKDHSDKRMPWQRFEIVRVSQGILKKAGTPRVPFCFCSQLSRAPGEYRNWLGHPSDLVPRS